MGIKGNQDPEEKKKRKCDDLHAQKTDRIRSAKEQVPSTIKSVVPPR